MYVDSLKQHMDKDGKYQKKHAHFTWAYRLANGEYANASNHYEGMTHRNINN